MTALRLRRTSAEKRTGRRPTERRVLREEIRDHLIEDILNGRLAPHDRIVETRVAERFGVSQAPVREALRDLELLGFVVSSPFRGALVRQTSIEDLVQLYPIRAVLEGLAAREAASRISNSQLKQLRKLLATMRMAAARGDKGAQVAADFSFHLTIVEASGNWLLKQIWERMRLATTTFLTVSKSHRSLDEIAQRHELVIQALEARDAAVAERAMRSHIEEPGMWIRTILEQEEAVKKASPPGQRVKRRERVKHRA
jgi:DNA-binding GntR family transcriptional regulator